MKKQYGISSQCPTMLNMQKHTMSARQNCQVCGAKYPIWSFSVILCSRSIDTAGLSSRSERGGQGGQERAG